MFAENKIDACIRGGHIQMSCHFVLHIPGEQFEISLLQFVWVIDWKILYLHSGVELAQGHPGKSQ